MRRLVTLLSTGLFAAALFVGVTLTSTTPASAATIAATTTCSNGVDNTPGLGLICEVSVENTITAIGGTATVTVRECHGAAGDPEASCSTVTNVLTEPVTAVTQCNDATNGGGGTLRCSVDIVNTFIGVAATPTSATVNQCVGSGDGITIGCAPFPATTTGATITQCNGSANGGTLVGLICTATGTETSAHLVTVNQCNDSTNGGGALVICSATMSSIVIAPTPSPAPTATVAPTASPAPTGTAAPGATATPASTATPGAGAPTPSTSPGRPGGPVPIDLPSFGSPSIDSLFPGLPDTSITATIAQNVNGVAVLGLAGVALLAGYFLISKPRRPNA